MKNLLVFIIIIFISCSKQEDNRCFKTIGIQKTIERKIQNFDTLEVYGNIEYVIVQDTVEKVIISAGENILEFITTEVVNRKLIIHNKNMCNFLRSYEKNKIKVHIHFKFINQLLYSGAHSIYNLDTITQINFRLDSWNGSGKINLNVNTNYLETYLHTGSCDLYVSGKSEIRNLYTSSNGYVYDENYFTKTYIINHRGTGDYYLGNFDIADIQMHSIGNIYYKGNPNFINKTIEGKGKLIKKDV